MERSERHVLQHAIESGRFDEARRASVAPYAPAPSVIEARCNEALASVPEDLQADAADALSTPAGEALSDPAWRRFVAAHVFANWTAYLGEGLRA